MKKNRNTLAHIIEELLDQGIINAFGDAVSIQDTDFRVVYQNDKAKEMIGDHVGEYCYRGFEDNDGVCEGCNLALTLKDGKARTVERHNPAKGDLVVEITTSAIRDPKGEIIAGIEVVRDITERKKLERLILEAKKDWEETFDTIHEAITIHDKDFNIIRANRAAEKILGTTFPRILSQKCYESYHGTEYAPQSCPSCRSLITGEPSTTEMFEPHLNKYLEVTAIPRFDSGHDIIGLIHIVRDITSRKQMEEERERLIHELKDALSRVKKLSGLLPVCASCSKIRDEKGDWTHVDVYIRDHSEAEITHGLCPECEKKHFPENFRTKD